MKEGIGGTFMIYVFLIFLAVYTAFLAVAFNYARAFRVKNKITDIIEQNEGITSYTDVSTESVLGQIDEYLGEVSYRIEGFTKNNYCPDDVYANLDRGYCINKTSHVIDGMIIEYYKVTTFIKLEIPFLEWFSYTIPIKGETRKIERIT